MNSYGSWPRTGRRIDFHSSDEDFRLEVETSRYINVLVVLDEFYLAKVCSICDTIINSEVTERETPLIRYAR